MTPTLTVVLPAYREEATIDEAVTRLVKCLDASEIYFQIRVVVDGPGDRTAEIVRHIADPRVSVIELEKNFGKGRAVRTGLTNCVSEFVGYMDSDLDLHPEALVDALKALQRSPEDVYGAVGSKLHPSSKVDYPFLRRVFSRIFKVVVKNAFSISLSDTQTGLKVFRREPLDEILPFLERSGFEFDLEILTRLSHAGGTFIEVPVSLDYHFTSTVNLGAGLRTLIDTIALAVQLRKSDGSTRRSESR